LAPFDRRRVAECRSRANMLEVIVREAFNAPGDLAPDDVYVGSDTGREW
jgi:hypothetical protein